MRHGYDTLNEVFILFRLKDQWAILYYFVHHIGEQQNELGVSEIEANIWLIRAAKKKGP